jgi:hypothetical protein
MAVQEGARAPGDSSEIDGIRNNNDAIRFDALGKKDG